MYKSRMLVTKQNVFYNDRQRRNIDYLYNTVIGWACHFTHFGDCFHTTDDPTNSVKALKEASWSSRSDFNPTRNTPPWYNECQATASRAQRKGPSVTKPQSAGPISCLEHSTTRVLYCTIVTRAAVLMFPFIPHTIITNQMRFRSA